MVARFRRARHGGLSVTFDEAEARLLAGLLGHQLELLGPGESPDDDPLAAAVGIGTATSLPEDPAVARLFPDAYPDDAEASADFRRYTESTLREAKRAAARRALETIGEPGVAHPLTAEDGEAWLGALNDLRLVLGERLGVTEELDELLDSLDDDDPRLGAFWVYDRLTYLQESLVRALS